MISAHEILPESAYVTRHSTHHLHKGCCVVSAVFRQWVSSRVGFRAPVGSESEPKWTGLQSLCENPRGLHFGKLPPLQTPLEWGVPGSHGIPC